MGKTKNGHGSCFATKVALLEERDRLLEIKRVLNGYTLEAIRLVDKRLDTIKEILEDINNTPVKK